MAASIAPIVVIGSEGLALELVRQLSLREDVLIFVADSSHQKALDARQACLGPRCRASICAVELDVLSDGSIAAAVRAIVRELDTRQLPFSLAGLIFAPDDQDLQTSDSHRIGDHQAVRVAMRKAHERLILGAAATTEAFLPYINAYMGSRKPVVLYLSGLDASLSRVQGQYSLPVSTARVALNGIAYHYGIQLRGARVLAVVPGFQPPGESRLDDERASRFLMVLIFGDGSNPVTTSALVDVAGTRLPY